MKTASLSPLPPIVAIGAALGAVSGLLSYHLTADAWRMLTVLDVPLLPGLYFGLALAFIVYRSGTRSWFELAILVILVSLAWFAAFKTTVQIQDYLGKFYAPGASSDVRQNLPYILGFAGIVGGIVGSAGTLAGASIGAKNLRRFDAWTKTILIGALAGALTEFHNHLWVLLMVWQATIAASIAYHLTKSYPGNGFTAANL